MAPARNQQGSSFLSHVISPPQGHLGLLTCCLCLVCETYHVWSPPHLPLFVCVECLQLLL